MLRPERRHLTYPLAGAILCLFAALGLVLAAGSAPAESRRDLKTVEKEIKRGERRASALRRKDIGLKRDIARLRAQMVKSARAVQKGEAVLSRLERKRGKSRRREAAAQRSVLAKRAEITATLAALQRLAMRPPETLIASPRDANRLVRSALVLRTVLPTLERRIVPLKRRAVILASVRANADRRRAKIRRTTAKLDGDRARLARLLARHRALKQRTASQRARTNARLRSLAAEASSLRDLLRRVQRRRARAKRAARAQPGNNHGAKPKLIRRFSATASRIVLPVRGRIARRFGQKTVSGAASKGIAIQARRGAQVVAPFDGRVVFAGQFRAYGQILIIEHGEGYHTLIAGLSRIDVAVNQWLVARQPIGAMSLTQSANTRLYLEMRRKGRPINPLPLVAAKNGQR